MTDCDYFAKPPNRLRFQNLGKPRTAGLCGRAAGACDCGPLSSAFIERVNRGRNPPKQGTAGREIPIPGTVFTGHFHTSPTNAATFVSRDCGEYTRHPSPQPRTQRLTRRNTGRFGWGWYHYPRSVLRGSETLRGRVSERQTLPLLGPGRWRSRRTQRACGTAMRLCASLSRGVAAPLGCVIPLLFLLPHRWASRFCSAASLAHRKLSVCSLVTAVRFLNRCSRRSMRETYPLGQRSGCRF